jgi:hypothetical protein
MPTVDLNTYVFKFGQYSFHTAREVLKIDPEYIFWCLNNLAEFDLCPQDIKELKDALNKKAKRKR